MSLENTLREKNLSRREIEVALEVIEGVSNKEVASKLRVEEKTIKFHLTSVYKKLGLRSRTGLAKYCFDETTKINAELPIPEGRRR